MRGPDCLMRGPDYLTSSPDCLISELIERKTEEKRVQAIEAKRCNLQNFHVLLSEQLRKKTPDFDLDCLVRGPDCLMRGIDCLMSSPDCLMSSPDCLMSQFIERKTEEKRVQAIEAKRYNLHHFHVLFARQRQIVALTVLLVVLTVL